MKKNLRLISSIYKLFLWLITVYKFINNFFVRTSVLNFDHYDVTQERMLLDSMYDVPGSDIIGVCVDEEVVAHGKSPLYIREPKKSSKKEDGSGKEEGVSPAAVESSVVV